MTFLHVLMDNLRVHFQDTRLVVGRRVVGMDYKKGNKSRTKPGPAIQVFLPGAMSNVDLIKKGGD